MHNSLLIYSVWYFSKQGRDMNKKNDVERKTT